MSTLDAADPPTPAPTRRRPPGRRADRPLSRRRAGLLAADGARRGAADVHPRHLPVLAGHRHPALSVARRSTTRPSNTPAPRRTPSRIPDRARHPGPALLGVLHRRARRRSDRRHVGRAQLRAAHTARSLCDLSGAALPAHPHRVPRHTFSPDRLGLALCNLRAVLVEPDHPDARPGVPGGAGAARAIQDAPYLLRQSARPVRRQRIAAPAARHSAVGACRRATDRRARGDFRQCRLDDAGNLGGPATRRC